MPSLARDYPAGTLLLSTLKNHNKLDRNEAAYGWYSYQKGGKESKESRVRDSSQVKEKGVRVKN
jgi:hypothetical protein